MKILKIFLLIIAVLVVIFFSIGLIIPVFNYGNSIVINAPREKVWTIYKDRKKEWIEGFQSQKLISGNIFTKGSEY